jgi:cation:H+ antiporter
VTGLATWLLTVLFLGSAAVIWAAGVRLSEYTDVLAQRLHLGAALGGVVLLAVATNLPEIAITVSAATSGHIEVAVSNILGGIAIQTVVLAVVDAVGVSARKPLTYLAASLVLVLEALLVVAVLVVTLMGTQMPTGLVIVRTTPAELLIALVWLLGLVLVNRAGRGLPWKDGGEAPHGQDRPRGHAEATKETAATARGVSTRRAAGVFGAAGLLTLAAGVVIERSGEELFGRLGLSGVLFGATVLAAATALPELSTGLTSARMGDYKLAMGDIFGGNAFLPVLFLPATLLSGKAVLPSASRSDLYLTALAALLSSVYAAGLIFRPQRQTARMGVDSVAVIALYALGVVGLVVLQ